LNDGPTLKITLGRGIENRSAAERHDSALIQCAVHLRALERSEVRLPVIREDISDRAMFGDDLLIGVDQRNVQ